MSKPSPTIYTITVMNGSETLSIQAPPGANLRQVLNMAGLSIYGTISQVLNCGGHGICATCGVWIRSGPAPVHWHDKMAEQYGYPRLSCQVQVEGDMSIELLPDKIIWGKLWPKLA